MTGSNRRRYELPGVNELSKAQEAINFMDPHGRCLVVGGPGTGKSVLALLRARRLAAERRRYRFVVFNVLLEIACRQLFPGIESVRWISWFNRVYADLCGRRPSHRSSQWADIDWPAAETAIEEALVEGARRPLADTFLVVDEGQDMPPDFYLALQDLGVEDLFVAADQNQQITDFNSTIEDLRGVLDLSIADVATLTENFRQKEKGYHVALLADAFYPGDPASPRPRLPPRNSVETPWLYTYQASGFRKIIEHILQRVVKRPTELVGIIACSNPTRRKYFDTLQAVAAATLTNTETVAVTTYFSGIEEEDKDRIRFDQGGIVVICAHSCKGLEFDTVFVADVNDFPYSPERSDQTQRLFYTMVSRARERVFLLREGGRHCPVDAIMPDDPNVLQRNER